MCLGVNVFVTIPYSPLRYLLFKFFDLFRLCLFLYRPLSCLFQFFQMFQDLVDGLCVFAEHDFATRQVLLPTVMPRQVASVPLSANMVNLSQHAPIDHVFGIVVQHAVVTLMPSRQVQLLLVGQTPHHLALGHVVRHQFLGQHMLASLECIAGGLGVQVQRQRDDHRFDVRIPDQ